MKNFTIASTIATLLFTALPILAETPETDQNKTHVAGSAIDQSHRLCPLRNTSLPNIWQRL